jgi:HSP20 family protein
MSLVLRNWEPFNLLREFDKSFFDNRAGSPWSPTVNISENEDGYVLKAELPGVSKEDIDIDLKDNTLTLKGEKKAEKKEEKENYIRVESSYGKFERSFYLSDDIDISKADANFKDGVLRIALKKKEEAKPKQIKVEVK